MEWGRWLIALFALAVLHLAQGDGVWADDGKSVAERRQSRTFPAVFQAWNRADNLPEEDALTTLARHDLVFHAPDFFGVHWQGTYAGLAEAFVEASVQEGRKRREELLHRNPAMILLAELRYRDAHRSYLPEDHAWWRREAGKIVPGWEEGGYYQLDFSNPDFRDHVAKQAKVIVDSGVFDGIMLDWWHDDEDRLALIKQIREQMGDKFVVLVNANDRQTPATAEFINGYFMECYRSQTAKDWNKIADTLIWAETHLRQPRINCVETWFHESRQDLKLMRATTTMTLTLSDGYCLFSDPNPLPTPDHLHDWYPFWNKTLGQAKAKGEHHADGTFHREFARGLAVYNPPGNKSVTLEFDTPRTSAATGRKSKTFSVDAGDGDLFLFEPK